MAAQRYHWVRGRSDEGRPAAKTSEKLRREFVGLMAMNYRVWPLVNLINFSMVPPPLRCVPLLAWFIAVQVPAQLSPFCFLFA